MTRATLDTIDLTDDQRRVVDAVLDAELRAAGARVAAVLLEGHTLTEAWRPGSVGATIRDTGRARLRQVLEGWQTPDGEGAALALATRWSDR